MHFIKNIPENNAWKFIETHPIKSAIGTVAVIAGAYIGKKWWNASKESEQQALRVDAVAKTVNATQPALEQRNNASSQFKIFLGTTAVFWGVLKLLSIYVGAANANKQRGVETPSNTNLPSIPLSNIITPPMPPINFTAIIHKSDSDIIKEIANSFDQIIKISQAIPYLKHLASSAIDYLTGKANSPSKKPPSQHSFLQDFSSDPNPINLNDPAHDLTLRALRNELSPSVSRPTLENQLLATLLKAEKPNILLIGAPGCGKTALVEHLAKRIVSGTAPEKLKKHRIVTVNASDFKAGTGLHGVYETRLNAFAKQLQETENLIVFIDEMHTLMENPQHSRSSNNPQNILKPLLTGGKIRVIGCTTEAESAQVLQDPAFTRRFTQIKVPGLPPKILKEIILQRTQKFEEIHRAKYTLQAVNTAIRLSSQLPGQTPDKELSLLDLAGAKNELRAQPQAQIMPRDVKNTFREIIGNSSTPNAQQPRSDLLGSKRLHLFPEMQLRQIYSRLKRIQHRSQDRTPPK